MLNDTECGRRKKEEFAVWTAFFLLCLLRFSYYGFRYFPQLDDYIQYHNYAYGKDFAGLWQMVQTLGLFGARPLAGLSDLYIWSAFWECPYVAVALLTLLYSLSAWFFRCVFSRYFQTGCLFYVIYLLLPLNFEGTWWLSASTRICTGLFFASLSAFLFVRFCARPRVLTAVSQIAVQIAACCFYEQILILSCVTLLLLWVLERKKGRRTLLAPASACGSAVLYLLCIWIFKDSPLYGNRGALMLPVSRYYFCEFLPNVCRQFYQVLVRGNVKLLQNGFLRGVKILLQDSGWFYVLLCLLLCGAVWWLSRKQRETKQSEKHASSVFASDTSKYPTASRKNMPEEQKPEVMRTEIMQNMTSEASVKKAEEKKPLCRNWAVKSGFATGNEESTAPLSALWQLVCGLLLALAPLSVFLVLYNAWFSFRNAVACLPGIALFAEGILRLLLHRMPRRFGSALYALPVAALIFVCMISSVSELNDYRQTWEDDRAVLHTVYTFFDGELPEERVAVLNLEPSYLAESNFTWHEHIHGVTESQWALKGALKAYYLAQNAEIHPIPVREILYSEWNYADLHISGFTRVLWYDSAENMLSEASVTEIQAGVYEVSCRGKAVLRIREDGHTAYAERLSQ